MILCEPVERAVQVHPLLVHDDGDDATARIPAPYYTTTTRPSRHCQADLRVTNLRNTHVVRI
jgi:hypothetical protein